MRILDPFVITHGNCLDGFCSAWVMAKALGSDTLFHYAIYNGPPPPDPDQLADRDVYMVDFSYSREEIVAIAEVAESLTIFDHHVTAQDELVGLEDELVKAGHDVRIVFDMNRSGAGIAWDEMFPNSKRHWLPMYVEDRDLWQFKLRESKTINAYLGTVPHSFSEWDRVAKMNPIKDVVPLGAGVVSYVDEYCRVVKQDARLVSFEGHPALMVNAHYKSCSELLHHFLENEPRAEVAISWYQRGDGAYQYSLRSRRNGVNVRELAEKFGGGGHVNAAGFTLTEFYRHLIEFTVHPPMESL